MPGTLTVVMGATGIGKTQLGLQFAAAGAEAEGQRGVIFDMHARVDSQNHAAYAERMFGWRLASQDPEQSTPLDDFFDPARPAPEYLHVFRNDGRRMSRRDVDFDTWHDWQAQLSARLDVTIAFFYGAFARGVRRAVIDGVDPADRQSQSIQFELFEYIYHQILRKESDWVARDLFRQQFRAGGRGGGPCLRPPSSRLPAALYNARVDARAADRTAARRWRYSRRRQHDSLPRQAARWASHAPRAACGQAPRQRVRRRDRAVSHHRPRA